MLTKEQNKAVNQILAEVSRNPLNSKLQFNAAVQEDGNVTYLDVSVFHLEQEPQVTQTFTIKRNGFWRVEGE